MDNIEQVSSDILEPYNYTVLQSKVIFEGYDNLLIEAKCEENTFIIKMFSETQKNNIPTIGEPEDKFIGGWYVQSRINKNLRDVVPEVIGSEFSNKRNFYIMDKVSYDKRNNWSDNMYLVQLCQDLGSILSDLHQISNNLIGGIPGKNSDPMINMRRYIKKVESNIEMILDDQKYKQDLDYLKNEYENIYNPKNKWLIHGNLEPTNILTNKAGIIKSIVDWESSMYADPLLDLAMCQANICDIYSRHSPWDLDTIQESLIESYQHAVNPNRLRILRAIVYINNIARIESSHYRLDHNQFDDKDDIKSAYINLLDDTLKTIK